MRYCLSRFISSALCLAAVPAGADSSLHYRLNGSEVVQEVVVKQGRVMIPSLDAKDRRDFLFDRTRQEAVLIDHSRQTFIRVNDQTLDRLSRQSEPLKPLLAGLSSQLGKLTPEQRAKWQNMLGGVDLDKIASAAKNELPSHLARKAGARKVGSFSCESVSVLRGKQKVAELCISQADAIGLSADDYATIRSLFDFAEHLANKTRGFSSLMGISIPAVSVQEIPGIPVEIRDLSGPRHETYSLAQIASSAGDSVAMDVPQGYRSEQLNLW